jgi:Dolichyl-phosphate-mannose-protein mannosyltransferase
VPDTAHAANPGLLAEMRAAGAPSAPTRREFAVLTGFALGVRLAYVAIFLRHYRPNSDANQYTQLATAFAHGHGLSDEFPFWFMHPSAFRPPLYPILLGLIYRVSGDRLLVGMLANVAIGAAVVALIAALAARVGGRRVAIASGVVAAVAPPLLFNDGVTLSEPLSLLLLLAAVIFLLDGRDVGAAVATGLLMLTRPSAQALVIVFAIWMVRSYGWRRALRFVLIAGVVVAPWVARNYVQLGSPTLVTSNGFNLAASYSPLALDNYGFADPFLSPEMQNLRYQHFTEPDIDATFRRYAIDQAREHPHAIPWHVKQSAQSWLELSKKRNESADKLDGRPIPFRRATLPFFFITFVLGVIGLWLGRRRVATRLAVLTAAYFWATSAVTVTAPRLRAPVDVIIYVGAGVCIVHMLERFGSSPADSPLTRRDVVTPRPVDRGRNRVLLASLATVLVLIAATVVPLRRHEELRAHRSATKVAQQAADSLEQIGAQFPVDATATQPALTAGAAADQLYALDGDLWKLLPQVSPTVEPVLRDAAERLYDVSVPTRTLVLIAIHAAARHPSSWTLSDIEAVYRRRRAADSTLPSWNELLAGTAVSRARQAVTALTRS